MSMEGNRENFFLDSFITFEPLPPLNFGKASSVIPKEN